jgi:hypothetical protein
MNTAELLKMFAAFAGVASDIVDLFCEENPELIDATTPRMMPPVPDDDVDPEVRAMIERGEL